MAQFTVNPQRVDPYKNFKFPCVSLARSIW
jgi:hypothetical protein